MSRRAHPQAFFEQMCSLAAGVLAVDPNPAHLAIVHVEQTKHFRAVVVQTIYGTQALMSLFTAMWPRVYRTQLTWRTRARRATSHRVSLHCADKDVFRGE